MYDPPTFQIQFQDHPEYDLQIQLQYLVARTGNALQEVQQLLLDLGQSICRYLEKERKLEWFGIGSFHMDEEGAISFQSKTMPTRYFIPVVYQQFERENSTASIEEKVYESENPEPETDDIVEIEEHTDEEQVNSGWQPWQKFALLIIVLSVALFTVRFFMGNFNPLGPTLQKLHPKVAPATYSKP